jgi:hypothetical protein
LNVKNTHIKVHTIPQFISVSFEGWKWRRKKWQQKNNLWLFSHNDFSSHLSAFTKYSRRQKWLFIQFKKCHQLYVFVIAIYLFLFKENPQIANLFRSHYALISVALKWVQNVYTLNFNAAHHRKWWWKMTRRSCQVLNINKLSELTTIKGLRWRFYGRRGILQDVITSFLNVKILFKKQAKRWWWKIYLWFKNFR